MSNNQSEGDESRENDPLRDKLETILELARSKRCGTVESTLLDNLRDATSSISARAKVEVHQLAVPLTPLLQADSRFPGHNVRLLRAEAGGVGFYPNFVGVPLVTKLLECGSASEAIAWLGKVLSTTFAFGHSITAVWGAPVAERVRITPDVELVPIAEIPDSPQKRWLATVSAHGFNTPMYSAPNLSPPESALITRRKIEHVIFSPDTPIDTGGYLETHELFKEITLALTAIGPRAPLTAVHWFTFEDPDLQLANILAHSYNQSAIEILPMFLTASYPLDPIEGAEIVGAYLVLKGRTRDVLRVSLQRLNQSQRRHDVGDRAVELCTGLEALLGDSQKTEMTHKIKSRAARLIGGTIVDRRRNASLVGAAYDIRSSLVHTGKVNTKAAIKIASDKLTPAEVIEQTQSLSAELVKIIIRRGALPEWPEFDVT